MSTQVDLIVVGLGPGGESLASGAAAAGFDVVAIDKHLVGGECPYYGCIPSKMMIRAADALAEARRIPALAGAVDVTPSWDKVAERIASEATDDWDDTVAVERLESAGVRVRHGVGRLTGPGRVDVELPDGSTESYVATRGVVLNPGTRPATPPIEGLAGTPFWTNREAVRATEVPQSLVVIGGGPIGCELAQVFARFGSRTTILQHGDRLLPQDEPEAADVLREALESEGIDVRLGATTEAVTHHAGEFTLRLAGGEVLTAAQVLIAAGRTPNLDDLGLETVGLDPGARSIDVDERMRAGERLWVIGDVAGHGAFTHLSMYQAAVARRDIVGEDGPPADHRATPHVTFTDPEVAGVGLTESAAREQGLSIAVGATQLQSSSRGFTHGPGARGLIKVVADLERRVLVGATVVGPSGGEILGLLALAVHAEVPLDSLRSMIYAYPTFHRAIESALEDLID